MHFHELTPADWRTQSRSADSLRPGPIAGTVVYQPWRYYFDDAGAVWFGPAPDNLFPLEPEWQRLERDRERRITITPSDLSEAFKLGLAVAHLSHSDSDCAATQRPLDLWGKPGNDVSGNRERQSSDEI